MKKKKTIEQLIEEEYLIHNDEEDDETYWTKEALRNALNTIERKIFITYLEHDCVYTTTAKAFKVSIPTLTKYVQGLKGKIIEYVDEKMKDDTTDY